MSNDSFAVLGGDFRQCFLANFLVEKGYTVHAFALPCFTGLSPHVTIETSFSEAIAKSSVVIPPTPFTKDGKTLFVLKPQEGIIPIDSFLEVLQANQTFVANSIPSWVMEQVGKKTLRIRDLSLSSFFQQQNAYLTAEGLLVPLLSLTSFSLMDQKILILGYGRCGEEIATLLSRFTTDIYVLDKDPKRLQLAKQLGLTPIANTDQATDLSTYSVIINTIPEPVLDRKAVITAPAQCVFFDIASAPGGFPEAWKATNVYRCPGLPGKYMPKTAGELLGQELLQQGQKNRHRVPHDYKRKD